MAVRQSILN